jgi:predicted glycosyltransferase
VKTAHPTAQPSDAPRRIVYYCQSLVGIGHLACSLRVIGELLTHADVDLVYGGIDGVPMPDHPRFRRLRLTTLLHDEDSGDFVDPAGGGDLDAVWAARAQAIAGFLHGRHDAIVVEFYPFGRRRFKREIMGLLDAVRGRSGQVPVFTSVREVLVPRPLENERRMVETVKKHIHTVFVRSDPQVLRLHATFSLAHEIEDRLVHTGYIAAPLPAQRPQRKAQVLVSQGGGNVGGELLCAAIDVAPLLPQLHFLLAAGTRTPAQELDDLRATVRSANVEIVPFLADFQQQLMASALSISMGGDNTLLDVLTAHTPALAYPYQGNAEQGIRIREFAAKGLLHELRPADLAPHRLKDRIETALAAPLPSLPIAIDGARVTSEHIRAVLNGARH